jgi:hypothetical protein
MSKFLSLPMLALLGGLAVASVAQGQPYIGFVYPAGAQQGSTVQIRLGGQRIDDVESVQIAGSGVTARLVEYRKMLSNQEVSLLRENLRQLQQDARMRAKQQRPQQDEMTRRIMARIQERIAGWVNTPANRSVASLVLAEITVAPDAEPGPREIRLATLSGATNPMTFHIGQFPEVAREPMGTARLPILGNEEAAERKRPAEEAEVSISIPCVTNGQVAAGEVNRYRFEAKQGQRLVISTQARELQPYIADAVPGWFQPVTTLYNARGQEVAFCDDFRFKPDGVIYYEVPADGEYVLSISDALFRGREDWVYRITIAERPFITSVFPLGSRVGQPADVRMQGWNLDGAQLQLPPTSAESGVYPIAAVQAGIVSNRVPFALDTLPERVEQEPNPTSSKAQKVQLPIILNGRINQSGDQDMFQFEGRAGQTIVAEVTARRLDSPLDSLLQLTDAAGNLLGLSDDHDDPATGWNTHHADSYLMLELPADGTYYVTLSDTTHTGGDEYAYRLRISEPRPDFALRVVPPSIGVRSNGSAAVSVYAIRKDGFSGDIRLSLKDPPQAITAWPVTLKSDQEMVRFPLRNSGTESQPPVPVVLQGRAVVGEQQLVHEALAAEDRMQAFLWRHLLPVEQFQVRPYNPRYQKPPAREASPVPPELLKEVAARGEEPKFTKKQVTGRLRQLEHLYENYLLTEDFYHKKVAECEVAY